MGCVDCPAYVHPGLYCCPHFNIPGLPSQSLLFGDWFWILNPCNYLLIVYPVSRCFFHKFSTSKDGNFIKKLHRNVGIPYQQDADALQMGVLSRLRPSLGLVLALFSIFQIDPDRNLRKINFFVFDPKALHHIIVKVGFLYIRHESIFLSPQDQYIYEETSASIQ